MVEIKFDFNKSFYSAMERARKEVKDLKVPLDLIGKDFLNSRKFIFKLKSKGQYDDFKNEKSKEQKIKAVGFAYPLLKRTGRLEDSITKKGGENIYFLSESSLIIGSNVPYAIFHQMGTKNMSMRPFLFIGPEASKYAIGPMAGFPERALNTLNSYILRVMGATFQEATGAKPKGAL